MNKLQTNYTNAKNEYDEYLESENWEEEIDEKLYNALAEAEKQLLDWAFAKAQKVAYISEKAQIAPVIEAYKEHKVAWFAIENKVIAAALKLS